MIFILAGGKNEALRTAAEAGLKLSQWRPVGPTTLRGIGADHEIWVSPCWKHRYGRFTQAIEADLKAALGRGSSSPRYVEIACHGHLA
jgi:hypothetical protein